MSALTYEEHIKRTLIGEGDLARAVAWKIKDVRGVGVAKVVDIDANGCMLVFDNNQMFLIQAEIKVIELEQAPAPEDPAI